MPKIISQKINTNSHIVSIYSYRSLDRDTINSKINYNNSLYNKNNSYKNYSDSYNFPANYPSVAQMQSTAKSIGTNLGTIPF